ncbi:uncharacterized protein ASPGLDRAFT_1314029 [Aspergillus glaucus CBS 516.65]|uniref:Uncharacterized protein n=1 Tax=Aspergillus glaucus CBS 516.65 TaxID=1160497 RepID=A0A1L9VQ86_ASPGL|nr:hypothetical protein ASPGLDRAFT_1314029 [Aspergillus glaucus CBS 516.65]OJJ86069.1 hypothetical protein ASPGLDRAFT_1314029 [Aspergillus glaucus CBS 516.65]
MWRTFQYFDGALCTCLLGLSRCGVCVFEYRVRALCLCIFLGQGFGLLAVYSPRIYSALIYSSILYLCLYLLLLTCFAGLVSHSPAFTCSLVACCVIELVESHVSLRLLHFYFRSMIV